MGGPQQQQQEAPAQVGPRHGGAGGFCHQHTRNCAPTSLNGGEVWECDCGCNPGVSCRIPADLVVSCLEGGLTPEECIGRLAPPQQGSAIAVRVIAAALIADGRAPSPAATGWEVR